MNETKGFFDLINPVKLQTELFNERLRILSISCFGLAAMLLVVVFALRGGLG